MMMPFLAVALGLVALVWSSERFVLGASAIARNLGISPLLIGLTIVGIGTSAPEIFVSAMAAWRDNAGIAIGNAIGSNIANVGLVVGVTALVAPLSVRSRTLKREFFLMYVVVLGAGVLLLDATLDQVDGAFLMTGFVVLMGVMCAIAFKARTTDPLSSEFAEEIPETMSMMLAGVWLALGLAVLLLSSKIIVWGAVQIALAFGVSDVVIGLTVVAIGTSLPELAASVMSALKGEPDIAIGNVIGSNMFNMLPVLALPGLIAPGSFPVEVLYRDYPVMLTVCVLLYLVVYGLRRRGSVSRIEGGVLLSVFIAYQAFLYMQTIGA